MGMSGDYEVAVEEGARGCGSGRCCSASAYVVTNLVYGVRSGANDFAAGSLAPIQTDVVPFLRTSDAKHPYGYSPKRRSAARDVGCNAVSSYDETSLDLAGEPRIVDGAIDCGCYERQKSKSGLLITVR